MEMFKMLLPFWSIVKLLIIAFVFSLLGRTETIVVSILGLLYVGQFNHGVELSKIKDDLHRDITRVLELVGEDREKIQERRKKTSAIPDPIATAVEATYHGLVGLLCLFMLFYTIMPWKQMALDVLTAMIAVWQAMIALRQALTP